jgi:flagellar motor protein MotB
MNVMLPHKWMLLLTAACPLMLAAAEVSEIQPGEAVERHLQDYEPVAQWVQDPDRVAREESDRVELREVVADLPETVKLTGVVAPIRFESGVADIPAETVQELARILEEMQHRKNVRLHLVGHADNQPLSPRLAAIYGDNAGLSRERAGQVAEYFQTALALAPEAISYEWAGDADPVASNSNEAGRALNRRVEVEVWYDEMRQGLAQQEVLIEADVARVKVCRMETVCKLRYVEGHARRARLQNLIAPLHYNDEAVDVSPQFVGQIEQALDNLSDRQNVQIKFVGYTDDRPLLDRTERIYGDHVGFSKAKARRVALAIQEQLKLPSAKISSDGRGTARPLATNMTPQGRALNRRIEVEFWYDDPLQELPDEPQLCPESAGAELVTREYEPSWGRLPAFSFSGGQPVLPSGYAATLKRALDDVADKQNARLRFVGYTGNERLERRTAAVYNDDIGLSSARARRVRDAVGQQLELDGSAAEFEGRGYLHADDVVNAGFIQGEDSYVAVQVVYDELAVLDDYEGVDVTRLTRELEPQEPLALNMMRITVDGVPVDDPQRSSADIQRCTDVALDDADIRFGFDNLRAAPRLNVRAEPASLVIPADVARQEDLLRVDPFRFRMYTNYAAFIERAEVRIFKAGQSRSAEPLAVLEIEPGTLATWQPPVEMLTATRQELNYLLRVYGTDGNFDETYLQPMWLVRGDDAGDAVAENAAATATPVIEPLALAAATSPDGASEMGPDAGRVEPMQTAEAAEVVDGTGNGADASTLEATVPAPPVVAPGVVPNDPLLAAWGDNDLALQNIDLGNSSVGVRGQRIPADHSVWVAGRQVPVDENGGFVAEEILPQGQNTVEVSVLDNEGSGEMYLRDLEFESSDWFYVGMADVTLSQNSGNGPIDIMSGDNPERDPDSSADGRLAFYVDGKFAEDWRLTASADTREAPLGDLFSNFTSKSPESLFRRIDPDYYYPTFGDDSTVEEMAPTMGKFYVKVSEDENYAKWGNTTIGYMDNELAQVDRGLYGANVHFESDDTTGFGERRFTVDSYAAEPGTVPSRDEFRGTGGSLYYLNRQDITIGSERVRIEIRDKASGIVTGVANLTPSVDYDIDYLQGRVVLTEPLSSVADDQLLVRSNALSGDETYLVVRYEYTPGFEELDTVEVGGQANYWFGDYVRLGMTASSSNKDEGDSNLTGGDLTVRMNTETWVKLQTGQSEGLVSNTLVSNDGGFGFSTYDPAIFDDASASAYRADVSVNSNDVVNFGDSRITMYVQEMEAGYSAAGQAALNDTSFYGGTVDVPLGDQLSVVAKLDNVDQTDGLQTSSQEYNVVYGFTPQWELSAGYRWDEREDNSVLAPAATQREGERADAVMQVGYQSMSDWDAYGFVQDTVSVTGNREENSRVGMGGSYQVSERLRLNAEISGGDQGAGGEIGTNYLHSDRTSMYLNYALENERSDNAMPGYQGQQGNLVAGMKTRFSDSASVFAEERYQHARTVTSLTHGAGISLAPTEKLNLGLTTDIGTLQDRATGAETKRQAGGIQVGYGFETLKLFSGVEYRLDETEQPDLSLAKRTTWLFRNNFKWQASESSRLLGKFNYSSSESSKGNFYDGGFTEAVLGYAFRPVNHDRLNTLVKYTYFYNMPTTDQVTLNNTAAEFVQKSHIAAIDVDYDLTQTLTVGGKYAYRLGSLSLDRDNEQFFDNSAALYVARVDWQFFTNWEALVEGRLLDMPDLDESRSGALLTISRYVGDHVKVGLGYNFADFSADLTDLSYDHKGFFLNLTGAM